MSVSVGFPTTEVGDIPVGNSLGTTTPLSVGTESQVLTVVDGEPAWADNAATASLDSLTDVAITSASRYDEILHDGTSFKNKRGVYDARARGLVGDGVTNDYTPIANTLADASSNGRHAKISLPARSIPFGSQVVLKSNSHIKGEGMYATSLVPSSAVTNAILSSSAFPIDELVLEDFSIDASSLAGGSALAMLGTFGARISKLIMRNIRIENLSKIGISLTGLSSADLENIYIENQGLGDGVGISIGSGGGDISITNYQWKWLSDGVSIDTGSAATEYESLVDRVTLHRPYGDLFWWLLPTFSSQSGSGGTVTYTSTVLTDTTKGFSGAGVTTSHYIRIMPVLATGTVATQRPMSFQVSGGSMLSAGIKRGEIIRTDDGTKWAIVTGVESNDIVRHEGWLSMTTMKPVTAPAAGTACTVYGVVIGVPTVVGATTLTVARWHDLDGTVWDGSAHALPSAGTRYEVMRDHPGYNIHSEGSAKNIEIYAPHIRRGWADQVSIYSPQTAIYGGLVEDGWDMGITLNGGWEWGNTGGQSTINGTRINHQGTGGIFCSASDTVINAPVITNTTWTNHVNLITLGGIILEDDNAGHGADRVIINSPIIDGGAKPHARYGISVRGDGSRTPSEIWINNPKLKGHTAPSGNKGDINIYGAGATKIHVRGVDMTETTMIHQSSATGGDYDLVGTATPESVVTAGIGSIFRRKDGGAGTSVYIKESGTGNTGWVAK